MVERILNQSPQYVPEASNLFARMDIQPSAIRKTIINEFIFQLQVAGIWNELDCLYILAAEDEQTAKLNWKSTSFNLTEVGTVGFVADRGYTNNANTNALSTGFIQNSHGVKFLSTNSSWGFYSRSLGVNNDYDMGFDTATYYLRVTNVNHTARWTTSQSSWTTASTALGFNSSSRNSTTMENFKNGVSLGPAARTTTANGTIAIEISRVEANFSLKQFSMAFMGSASINQLTFYNIIQWYLTQIGAAV